MAAAVWTHSMAWSRAALQAQSREKASATNRCSAIGFAAGDSWVRFAWNAGTSASRRCGSEPASPRAGCGHARPASGPGRSRPPPARMSDRQSAATASCFPERAHDAPPENSQFRASFRSRPWLVRMSDRQNGATASCSLGRVHDGRPENSHFRAGRSGEIRSSSCCWQARRLRAAPVLICRLSERACLDSNWLHATRAADQQQSA